MLKWVRSHLLSPVMGVAGGHQGRVRAAWQGSCRARAEARRGRRARGRPRSCGDRPQGLRALRDDGGSSRVREGKWPRSRPAGGCLGRDGALVPAKHSRARASQLLPARLHGRSCMASSLTAAPSRPRLLPNPRWPLFQTSRSGKQCWAHDDLQEPRSSRRQEGRRHRLHRTSARVLSVRYARCSIPCAVYP